MCRIFGEITRNTLTCQSIFKNLTLMSKSGGPDNTSFFTNEMVQFGFNRLAILDTSDLGNQPISSPSSRYILMLNGEIYNFHDLTKEYELEGLRSGSDAEVVAHLLDKIGVHATIELLNGMFAISIWDNLQEKLFLVRDFAGIKPLFYTLTSKGFVFGSQFNQLLKHPWQENWQFSTTGLREYLQLGYMPGPKTIVQGVFQLEPGTMLTYDASQGQYEIETFKKFFIDDEKSLLEETADLTIDATESALIRAVERQMVADVPLGVFLSGGIDSTLVAAIASKHRKDLVSLTIGFEDEVLDESEQAESYAQAIGILNKKEILSERQLLSIIDEHFDSLSEPLADYSSLPTYLISKTASQDFKVMLSGDGGDELFWGYPRFKTFANSAQFFRLPNQFGRKLIKKTLKGLGKDITGFLGEKDIGHANLAFHSYLGSSLMDQIFPNSSISESVLKGYQSNVRSKNNTLLYLRRNEFYYHLQKVLAKVDRMSMANGLEVRVPLLDEEVLRVAQSISPALHIHGNLKSVLKQVLYRYIPKSSVLQGKKGFTPPLKQWSKGVLRQEIEQEISKLSARTGYYLNQQTINDFTVQYFNNQHNNLPGLWTLYVLSKWLSINDFSNQGEMV